MTTIREILEAARKRGDDMEAFMDYELCVTIAPYNGRPEHVCLSMLSYPKTTHSCKYYNPGSEGADSNGEVFSQGKITLDAYLVEGVSFRRVKKKAEFRDEEKLYTLAGSSGTVTGKGEM